MGRGAYRIAPAERQARAAQNPGDMPPARNYVPSP